MRMDLPFRAIAIVISASVARRPYMNMLEPTRHLSINFPKQKYNESLIAPTFDNLTDRCIIYDRHQPTMFIDQFASCIAGSWPTGRALGCGLRPRLSAKPSVATQRMRCRFSSALKFCCDVLKCYGFPAMDKVDRVGA